MKVRTAHVSLEVFDNAEQRAKDNDKIFERAVNRRYAWITGTEANEDVARDLIRTAREAEYRPWVPTHQAEGRDEGEGTDCWIAVREDLISGNFTPDFTPVIPSAGRLYHEQGLPNAENLRPRWQQKGLVSVSFDCDKLVGRIGLGVTHHLTKGRVDGPDSVIHGVDHYEWNQKLDRAVTEWAKEVAAGRNLAFFNTDRNLSDRRSGEDEIKGLTTLADELRAWQPTGHGDIDWMMSFNKDGRVTPVSFTVLDDREFHLYTDHYFCEGVYNVEVPRR